MCQNSWDKTKPILREKKFRALNIFIIELNMKSSILFFSRKNINNKINERKVMEKN